MAWTQPVPDSAGVTGQDNLYRVQLTPSAGGAVTVSSPQCLTCKAFDANGAPTATNANGASSGASLSRDGVWLAWETTASNLKGEGKTSPCPSASSRVFLRNLSTLVTRELSLPGSGGGCGSSGQGATQPSVDGSGERVVFQSDQPLAGSDRNNLADVYLVAPDSSAPRRLSNIGGARCQLRRQQRRPRRPRGGHRSGRADAAAAVALGQRR